MDVENETLRWPTNLDHAGIVQRLVLVRDAARKAGLEDLAARFAEVETLPARTIASRVVAALHNVLRELKQESERRSDAAQRHVRDFCKRHKIAMLDMPGRCGHMCRAIPQEDLRAS